MDDRRVESFLAQPVQADDRGRARDREMADPVDPFALTGQDRDPGIPRIHGHEMLAEPGQAVQVPELARTAAAAPDITHVPAVRSEDPDRGGEVVGHVDGALGIRHDRPDPPELFRPALDRAQSEHGLDRPGGAGPTFRTWTPPAIMSTGVSTTDAPGSPPAPHPANNIAYATTAQSNPPGLDLAAARTVRAARAAGRPGYRGATHLFSSLRSTPPIPMTKPVKA